MAQSIAKSPATCVGSPATVCPARGSFATGMPLTVNVQNLKTAEESKIPPTSRSADLETPEDVMKAWTAEYFSSVPASEPAPPELLGEEYFEVKISTKGGLGAFARCDIPRGTVILCESPLVRANDAGIVAAFEQLDDERKEKFLQLSAYDEIDKHHAAAIYKTNRFRTGHNCGTFFTASRFNHACIPHLYYSWNESHGQLTFRVERAVRAGDEITISYGQSPYDLFANYGFVCDCGDCEPPRTPEEQARARAPRSGDWYEDAFGAKRSANDLGFADWKVFGAW